MTACVSCRLHLLRDGFENLINRETEGRGRCQNFPTHREVITADRKHTLALYSIYYIPNRSNAK